MKTVQNYLQNQINTLKGENSKLSELLDRKTESLAKEVEDHYTTRRTLEAEIQTQKDKLANARD